jgi:hypothetical protein
LDECHEYKYHAHAASVGSHPWLDCVVTVRWRGFLLVVTHTFLSEFRYSPFRLVIVRASHTFNRFLREGRQVYVHVFESYEGSVQKKNIDVNDKEFGSQCENNIVDEYF